MKLEHLIQSYNFNRIPAKIKEEIQEGKERAGIINFYDGITASYLLDDEDIVVTIKIFFNCITEEKTMSNQIEHTTKILNIIQKTIMLLDNVSQKETNMILKKLGLFNNTFKQGKRIRNLEHSYRVEIIGGLLCFSINETD